MRKKRRSALGPTLAGLGVLVGAGAALTLTLMGLPVSRSGGSPARVVVPPGATAESVGRTLAQKHLIRSAWWWERIAGRGPLVPGVYDLAPSESPARILHKLSHGEFATVKVTFPEGFTLRKIAARLVEKNALTSDAEFLTLAQARGKSFKAEFPLPANLEGYLFPDTYRFSAGGDARHAIQRMLDNFGKKAWPSVKASKKPLARTLTVASLVEREAEVEEDRAKIAGVIENRLKKNMRLQIDAAVQYALPAHKSRLMFADLKFPSPYNTYLNLGLPPTPICSPGLPSIRAALDPESSNDLFYVAGPDGRKHLFAATFAEHRKNIQSVRGGQPR